MLVCEPHGLRACNTYRVIIPSGIIPVSFRCGLYREKIIPSGVSLYIGTPE